LVINKESILIINDKKNIKIKTFLGKKFYQNAFLGKNQWQKHI